VLGKAVNVQVVKGEVLVSTPAKAGRARTSQVKGRRFVPLRRATQIPVGSLLDTRRGTVRLTSARDPAGTTQSGTFASGVFQVLQSRRRSARGLTDLRLKGSSFRTCSSRRSSVRATGELAASGAARRRSRRTVRRLRSNARGRFRTRGRYSAATVRGTLWEIRDRCDGTLTKVTRGSVIVRDLRRRRNVKLRTGRSYLAPAPGRR
jgi:hypothetical protein